MADLRNFGLIFSSPSAVARNLGEAPAWYLPLVVIILVTVIFTFSTQTYQLEYQRQMLEKIKQHTGRDFDIEARLKPSAGKLAMSGMGAAVGVGFFLLVGAAILNGIAAVMGGRGGFRRMFTFYGYASLVTSLGSLIKIPLVFAKKSIDVRTSLAAFAPGVPFDSPVGILLGSTDIFSIWALVATIIGFNVLTELGMKKSIAVGIGLYALFVLFSVSMGVLRAKTIG